MPELAVINYQQRPCPAATAESGETVKENTTSSTSYTSKGVADNTAVICAAHVTSTCACRVDLLIKHL